MVEIVAACLASSPAVLASAVQPPWHARIARVPAVERPEPEKLPTPTDIDAKPAGDEAERARRGVPERSAAGACQALAGDDAAPAARRSGGSSSIG